MVEIYKREKIDHLNLINNETVVKKIIYKFEATNPILIYKVEIYINH